MSPGAGAGAVPGGLTGRIDGAGGSTAAGGCAEGGTTAAGGCALGGGGFTGWICAGGCAAGAAGLTGCTWAARSSPAELR